MSKYHILNVLIFKSKQLNTYIQIFKKNINQIYIYSNLCKLQPNSDPFRFQTKNKLNAALFSGSNFKFFFHIFQNYL